MDRVKGKLYSSSFSRFLLTVLLQRAKLMIVTDDVEWSYDVVGNYPEFNVHNLSIASKIDNGQSRSQVSK